MAREILPSGNTTPGFSPRSLTPSTAATSVSRSTKNKMVIEDSEEDELASDDVDEAPAPKKIRVSSSKRAAAGRSRSTPARKSAIRASGNLVPVLDIGSDEDERVQSDSDGGDDSDVSLVSSQLTTVSTASTVSDAKGKKRVIDISDDEDEIANPLPDEDLDLPAALQLIHDLSGSNASKSAQAAARRVVEKLMASRSQNIGDDESLDEDLRMTIGSSKQRAKPKTKTKVKQAKGFKPFKGKGSTLDGEDISSAESDVESDSSALSALSGEEDTKTQGKRKREAKGKGKKPKLPQWQKTQLVLEKHHPELVDCWGKLEREMEVFKPEAVQQPDGLSLTLLPFQLEGLNWMKKQEARAWKGGLQSDEMGMGKTIQSIALILTDHDPKVKRHTLIIAPTVAIMQWRNEFNRHTSCFKVLVWHGASRSSSTKELKEYDIVLTSYAVLESAFRRQNSGFKKNGELHKEPSLLHKIKWHRIILDEAHNIKDRSCNTARGAFALRGEYRWCLSGTPLMNRVGELFSMLRFLGVTPVSSYFCKKCPCTSAHWSFSNKRTCDGCGHTPMAHTCFWNQEILKPIQKYGHVGQGEVAFSKLRILLDRLMLRRTKLERADDLGLPPRTVMVRRDHFTEEEEELYTSLFKDIKRKFTTYVAEGTVLNNYGNIFQLITRMRQMALHPDMVLKSRTAKGISEALAELNEEPIHTCRICLNEAEDPIVSKCRHVYCRDCVRSYVETAAPADCVVCHLPLTIDLEQRSIDEADGAVKTRQGILDRVDPSKWRTSTKIEALVEELSKLRSEDCTIKSLVFSQFTTFLDLVARRLQIAGFKIVRLQGNMTPEARDRTIKYFTETTDCTVFLLSLKAGGVALNLVEASHVYVLDPWRVEPRRHLILSPVANRISDLHIVEYQAMDRVHRIGQRRPVTVTRLVIDNSIERQILELQKKKERMLAAAMGDDADAMARLTPEDLSFLFSS